MYEKRVIGGSKFFFKLFQLPTNKDAYSVLAIIYLGRNNRLSSWYYLLLVLFFITGLDVQLKTKLKQINFINLIM